ncbi:protein kinase, putative [Talaromyces stipitatus ATCC 10500]|uniref:Protein kinase, putative n=1 Tax=Talaromyces stipitatus (strain ATCC 10500 / CBS 375.48 / QM 6759 / NRRL 1006) TaxID=441959 RepID=B8M2Q6_TALSN|nr:protein kinase, putative [Talaromyces stipitatus ATCC 10500]EED21967.1 protein kinase, putative [Talaromyces stipitatus ATCC 10500]
MLEPPDNRESKDHTGDQKLEAGNIHLQQLTSPRSGILTVKLGWAYRLSLPDDLDDSNPELSKRWRLYAIGEYEGFQTSTEVTATMAAKGAVLWGAWQRPFKFEVSASPSSELKISLFARNSGFDTSMLISWGDYENQVIFLEMVRLNPFLMGSGLQKVDIQNGTGRLEAEISYIRKEALPLETSEIWSVRRENNPGNLDLIYVEKKETGQSYGMKAIDIHTIVHNDLAASGLSDMDTNIDINMAPRLTLRCAIQHPFHRTAQIFFQDPVVDIFLDHLQMERQFDINKARYYAAELVCTLEYLHNQNITLGSLELQNILLDSSGHASLCEPGIFGLKLGARDDCISPSTTAYPAPEALFDNQEVSGAVDWWALRTIHYEMLTGIPHFYHKDSGERHNNILNQEDPTASRESAINWKGYFNQAFQ